jgi:hypothetical protein
MKKKWVKIGKNKILAKSCKRRRDVNRRTIPASAYGGGGCRFNNIDLIINMALL